MGNVGGIEIADRDLGDGGMKEQLVFREIDITGFLGRKDDSMGAVLERGLELLYINSEAFNLFIGKSLTKGMMSAGCVVSLCASSSL